MIGFLASILIRMYESLDSKNHRGICHVLFWPLLATFVFFCVLAHGVVCLTFETWWADEICPEIDTISIVQIVRIDHLFNEFTY